MLGKEGRKTLFFFINMSVILRNYPTSLNNNGGSEEGFPPGDIKIIETSTSSGTISVKWSDPDDTIINGVTISTWAGTILIRNDSHYPTSINDGILVINNTTKNAYTDKWFNDTGLINDHMYYYRFFTYSTDNVYNDSNNLLFRRIVNGVGNPIFGENTWEEIQSAIDYGTAERYWSIGDEIQLSIRPLIGSNYVDANCTLQIWDFDHFDKADGSGKAKICLGCKDLYISYLLNMYSGNNGGWADTYFRATTAGRIYDSFPDELQNIVKEVIVPYNGGTGTNESQNEIYTCNDKVFIPSYAELGISSSPNSGTIHPIFSDNKSRIKYNKYSNTSSSNYGLPEEYWARDTTSTAFSYITEYGDTGGFAANDSKGIAFCFNI